MLSVVLLSFAEVEALRRRNLSLQDEIEELRRNSIAAYKR